MHELNFLGLTFYKQLHWKSHIENFLNRCSRNLSILNRLKRLLPLNLNIILYNSPILPHLNNGITACGYKFDKLKKIDASDLGLSGSRPVLVISASDLGLVSGDLGLVLQNIIKSVYAFELIIVVICTYC